MPGALLVAALGLELEHPQLRAALVREHLRLDRDLLQRIGAEDGVVGAEEDRFERHGGALVIGQALDEQGLVLLDAVLLAAGLHDRVHGSGHSEAVDSALAAERRRPPLRPRRRGLDSRASSPPSPFSRGESSSSTAFAAVRPGSSMRTRRFSPTNLPPPATETM